MHKINVLCLALNDFNTSLEELKEFLKFDVTFFDDRHEILKKNDYQILLIHEHFLKKNSIQLESLKEKQSIKIFLSITNKTIPEYVNYSLKLPTNLKELNTLIENSVIKKNFNKNSSIKIKNYILDKNEKKLSQNDKSIYLTEKEIQLLELFLKTKKSLNKDQILKDVWHYSEEADTHTVETHIYRLRKKIKDEFFDKEFIINEKDGYHL
tara:strand:+ start:1378 stop:2007 length:630 start_codon:yes stop_codon:yes gene_type:complete